MRGEQHVIAMVSEVNVQDSLGIVLAESDSLFDSSGKPAPWLTYMTALISVISFLVSTFVAYRQYKKDQRENEGDTSDIAIHLSKGLGSVIIRNTSVDIANKVTVQFLADCFPLEPVLLTHKVSKLKPAKQHEFDNGNFFPSFSQKVTKELLKSFDPKQVIVARIKVVAKWHSKLGKARSTEAIFPVCWEWRHCTTIPVEDLPANPGFRPGLPLDYALVFRYESMEQSSKNFSIILNPRDLDALSPSLRQRYLRSEDLCSRDPGLGTE